MLMHNVFHAGPMHNAINKLQCEMHIGPTITIISLSIPAVSAAVTPIRHAVLELSRGVQCPAVQPQGPVCLVMVTFLVHPALLSLKEQDTSQSRLIVDIQCVDPVTAPVMSMFARDIVHR